MKPVRAGLAAAVMALVLAGCGPGATSVARVVDDRTIDGPFVGPQQYALFLDGAIAEAAGALDDAATAFEKLAALDERDPEVFARIAQVRCARDPSDGRARAAVERALSIDPEYGPALAAAARCGMKLEDALARAARAEPTSMDIQLAYARASSRTSSADEAPARARLLALTLDQPRSGDALGALASWADAHDDVDLWVLALGSMARRAPRLDADVARGALALAGEGHIARARRVAAALLDERARRGHDGAPLAEDVRAALGRLAVDEAAERGDEEAMRRRAVVARLSLGEVAARAALAGRTDVARSVAEATLRADPEDVGSRMVVLALGRGSVAEGAGRRVAVAPAAACALLGRALWEAGDAVAGRGLACDAAASDDPLVLAVLVDLAARGAVDDQALPAAGRVELAWRQRAPMRDIPQGLDARHELLARAQVDPRGEKTARLSARLARRGATDPMVLAALVAVTHARGQTVDALTRAAITSAPPVDPLLDATLLEALPLGPERVRVRARFAGLAATPAERALVR